MRIADTVYHYGNYEIRALKRISTNLNDYYKAEVNRIIENSINLLSIFTSIVYPPTYTNGLKDLAGFLGFHWSEKGASGIQSIVWRKKWELEQDDNYRQKLLGYNNEDLRALLCIKSWLEQIPDVVEQGNSNQFQCDRCGHVFVPKEFQAHKLTDKHGHNLMSWAMNQHITYRIGISNLPDMIRESFHIDVSYWAVYGFKERLAKEYANTLEEIKQNIIRGKLLHADETQVKKIAEYKTGYVWVFTNMDSVFYLLKPTREADFLKDLLDGFHGVLVSDYYPGYDSLPCPQQKCLVHLIRDLNDDLLHHQLDTEYKHVVKNFGALLRKIMETVNTYGLKKRHLHKHQRDVKRFYRQVLNCDYESELVAKYQKRLNKYREKLFTFLNYDGIPWNNNNAEHAIKPFAKYRDSITGKFTVQGLENYLTLLSIQQTCVYRGVRFLDFLKSGERSIEEYCRKN